MNNMNNYDEIVSIEEIGETDTIDIEIDSDERVFYANGILTHNSGYSQSEMGMDNIADSMAIAHTADLIISIVQPDDLKENSQMKFEIIKSRISAGGKSGIVNFDKETLRIINQSEVAPKEESNIVKDIANIDGIT